MRTISITLACIQCFVAIMALPAGWSLMTMPDGSGIGLPPDTLDNTPFSDFLIPGLVLFLGIGLANVIGAIVTFRQSKALGLIGLALGIFLLAWILIQIYFIGLIHFLQHIFTIIAILEIVLSGIYLAKFRGPNTLAKG